MSDTNYDEIIQSYRLLDKNSGVFDTSKDIQKKMINIEWKKVGIYILSYFIVGMIIIGILNPKMIKTEEKFSFKKFLYVSSILSLGIIGVNFLIKYIMNKIM